MGRSYSSYVIRCWSQSGSEQRIEVEDIRTATRVRFRSFPEALMWIEQRHHSPTEPVPAADSDPSLSERTGVRVAQ